MQLKLNLDPCPGCGSTLHSGCGYDPAEVAPALSVQEALQLMVRRYRDPGQTHEFIVGNEGERPSKIVIKPDAPAR